MTKNPKPILPRQIRRFLKRIHYKCEGVTELRCIDPTTGRCRLSWPKSIHEAVRIVKQEGISTNVYVGVCTRIDSSSGTKANLCKWPGISVDVDFKDFPGGESEAWERLKAFPLQPTMVVKSGGGLHVYWLLELPRKITSKSLQKFEALNRAFASQLGGDFACCELAHVLRVPGTNNIPNAKKKALGRKKSEVTLFKSEGPRYRLDKLEAIANAAILPDRFLNLLKTDARLKTTWDGTRDDLKDDSRSGYEMSMADQLAEYGFLEKEIETILEHMPSGRGHDGSRASRLHTIKKAHQWQTQIRPLSGAQGPSLTKRSSPADLADAFLRESGLLNEEGYAEIRYYRDDWYLYETGTFHKKAHSDIKSRVTRFISQTPARDRGTETLIRNVLGQVQSQIIIPSDVELPIEVRPQGFNPIPQLWTFTNGHLDSEALLRDTSPSLIAHTPHLITTTTFPFAFDPKARCPQWEKFIRQILPEKESRYLLQEIIGYTLTNTNKYQKVFVYYGSGGNGKTTVTSTHTHLLGQSNVSTLPLEIFSSSHGLENTLGKCLNISNDINDVDKAGEGLIKAFSGGDVVYFNPKHKPGFSALPTAKLLFVGNHLPPFRDRSDGIWRRVIVLPFCVGIPQDQQNENLGDVLLTELPGVFKWALRGLKRLEENRQFTIPQSSQELFDEWKTESNPLRMFLTENLEVAPQGSIPILGLNQLYAQHCKDFNFSHPATANTLGKELRVVFPKTERRRLTPRGQTQRVYIYTGIRWKKN